MIIGIFYGIKTMIAAMMVNNLVSYYINSYWSGKLIGYSTFQQIKDIIPAFILAFSMALTVFSVGVVVSLSPLIMLIIQIFVGATFIIIVSEVFRFRDYLIIKSLLVDKINS